MNNEVKLSFWEILFSPFISMKNMVTSKSDVDGGNLDPKDPIGAELLESLYKIGNKVKKKNFGGSGKGQSHEESEVDSTKTPSKETLNVKVDVNVEEAIENAEKNKTKQVKAEKQL